MGLPRSQHYGLTVRSGASAKAEGFAAFVMPPAGQAILVRHGFLPAGH
jgi:ABC-type molybdate transport system substrate-binding protein